MPRVVPRVLYVLRLNGSLLLGETGSAGKPTVDINIPVSSFFSQGMRRLQDNPEDPEQVAPVWPYGRVPYRQEDGGMPMEGYPYPPVPTMSPLPPQGRPMVPPRCVCVSVCGSPHRSSALF